jgi:hypothetical protein
MKSRALLVPLAGLVLCGCSTAPLSIVSDRQVYSPVSLHHYPVRIEAVDHSGNLESPVFLEPGLHEMTIAAPPQSGFREPVLKNYTLNLAPCTRYYVAAYRRTSLTRDWTLIIEAQERVAGCDPEQEWQKAGRTPPAETPAGPAAVIVGG